MAERQVNMHQGGNVGGATIGHNVGGIIQITNNSTEPPLRHICLRSLFFSDTLTIEGPSRPAAEPAQYQSWVRQGGTLLIEGDIGTGKSTLLLQLLRSMRDEYRGKSLWEAPRVLSFFFKRTGKPEERTYLGLLLLLMHQILRNDEALQVDFMETSEFEEKYQAQGAPGEKWHWKVYDLESCLVKYLERYLQRGRVFLYIDAVEESEPHDVDAIREFLSRLMQHDRQRMAVCFTSRPRAQYQWKPDYKVAVDNTWQIKHYLHEALRTYPEDQASMLSDAIRAKAGTNFQLAATVAPMMLRLHESAKQKSAAGHAGQNNYASLLNEAKKIPSELPAVYKLILDELSVPQAKVVVKIFSWMMFAFRPLTLQELRDALFIEPPGSLPPLQMDADLEQTLPKNVDGWRAYLLKLCRGLVKTSKTNRTVVRALDKDDPTIFMRDIAATVGGYFGKVPGKPYSDRMMLDEKVEIVQFDHGSVYEYLASGGLSHLEAVAHSRPSSNSTSSYIYTHSYLSRSLICCCGMEKEQFLSEHGGSENLDYTAYYWTRSHPLTWYALDYTLKHAEAASEDGTFEDLLASDLMSSRFEFWSVTSERGWFLEGDTFNTWKEWPIGFLTTTPKGFTSRLRATQFASNDAGYTLFDIWFPNDVPLRPLHLAAAEGNFTMAYTLLRLNFPTNLHTENDDSALAYATTPGIAAMIRTAVQYKKTRPTVAGFIAPGPTLAAFVSLLGLKVVWDGDWKSRLTAMWTNIGMMFWRKEMHEYFIKELQAAKAKRQAAIEE